MKRPASVTTFGILNIVFAGIGMLGVAATVAMLSGRGGAANPVLTLMRDNSAYAAWTKISLPLGILSCVALMAAGIGLLWLKPWGRKLSIGYAIYAILFGILGTVINFMFLIRPMLEEAARNKQGPEAASAIGGAIGGGVGGCLGIVYPILLLIFMTRPKLVAAFCPDTGPPVIPPSAP